LHFAVAPVGSVLLAATLGALVEAAAGCETVPDVGGVAAGAVAAGAGVRGAAGTAGLAEPPLAAGDALVAAFWTPPCPLHAPRPEDADAVPSLQVVEPVVPAVDVADPDGDGGVSGAAGTAALEGSDFGVFCWPP
jgi:hypothetical protein